MPFLHLPPIHMTVLLHYILSGVAGFLTFFALLVLILGLGGGGRKDVVEARLDQVTSRVRSLEEIEMSAPFAERFFKPIAAQLASVMSRITPARLVDNSQKLLIGAGLNGRMQVSDFLGIKAIGLLIGAALAVLGALGLHFITSPWLLVAVLVLGLLGYFAPDYYVRNMGNRRKAQLQRELPDIIDLLTISVEAGLGFDLALDRIVRKSDSALSLEFARVLQEMRIGVSRREALRALADRTGVDDLGTFVSAIIQAEQLGASVAKVLRIQSIEMRLRRRQRAELLAHQAPVKILFPMAFLIFPPIFIVVLGPAIPRIIKVFAPDVPL